MRSRLSTLYFLTTIFIYGATFANDAQKLIDNSIFYIAESDITLAQESLRSTTNSIRNDRSLKSDKIQSDLKLLQVTKNNVEEIRKEFKLHKERKAQVNCSSVDLRGQKLGPVRDQGSIGWCFAYVAADLISYELGDRASARSVAQNYHKGAGFKDSNEYIHGGYIGKAVSRSLTNGVCLEKDLPSDNKFYYEVNNTKYKFSASFNELENLQNKYRQRLIDQLADHFLNDKWLAKYNQKFGKSDKYYEELKCKSRDILESTFSSFDFEDIEQIMSQTTFNEYIEALFAKVCPASKQVKKSIKVQESWINKSDINNHYDTLQTLNDILDGKKGTPRIVGIAYDDSLIKSKNSIYDKPTHASSVVARKQNPKTGNCMYLVRNSYGNTYKRSLDDENGNIWVEQDEFLENLSAISYIEK